MYKYFGLIVFIACLFFFARPIRATCPSTLNNTSITISSSDNCTIPQGTTTYLDDSSNTESSTANAGQLSLSGTNGSPAALTISANSTLKTGKVVIGNFSSITIVNTGVINPGSTVILYVTDVDADGWAANFTIYTASASGRRRLGLMRSMTVADCDDTAGHYNVANSCCTPSAHYVDADGDGYGTGSSSNICDTAGYVTNNTDCNDTGTNSANVYISATCYADPDNDDYGTQGSSALTCTNNATCGSATWASGANGTAASNSTFSATADDCGPSDASAHPGQTVGDSAGFTYYSGGTSYDYNCNGSSTKYGTNYDRTNTAGTLGCKNAAGCNNITQLTDFPLTTISCGQVGAVCATSVNCNYFCVVEYGSCNCASRTRCSARTTGTQKCL